MRISIIDTATGIEAQRLDGSTVTPLDTPSAWSPDSAWLVFVSGSDVRAWRTADARTVTIDADLRNAGSDSPVSGEPPQSCPTRG